MSETQTIEQRLAWLLPREKINNLQHESIVHMRGAARQNACLWFYLFGRWHWTNGKWRGWELFTRMGWRGIWRNPYFWHDTFGVYWARLTLCKHPDPKVISLASEPLYIHCFRCERKLNND